MLLNDVARCVGETSTIHPGRPLPYCVPCARRAMPADGAECQHITPAVVRVDGQFYCANRRFDGGNHESDCAPTSEATQPLDVGPAKGCVEGQKSAFCHAGVTAGVVRT